MHTCTLLCPWFLHYHLCICTEGDPEVYRSLKTFSVQVVKKVSSPPQQTPTHPVTGEDQAQRLLEDTHVCSTLYICLYVYIFVPSCHSPGLISCCLFVFYVVMCCCVMLGHRPSSQGWASGSCSRMLPCVVLYVLCVCHFGVRWGRGDSFLSVGMLYTIILCTASVNCTSEREPDGIRHLPPH